MVETLPPRRRIEKPLGLYIIAVLDFLAIGVVPLVTTVLAARSEEGMPFLAVLLLVGLAVSVMGAAVWAAAGDNAGRYLLLGLVTLSAILFILNSVVILSDGETGAKPIAAVAVIIRAIFWIAINWWYFNRQHVVAYFKQNS